MVINGFGGIPLNPPTQQKRRCLMFNQNDTEKDTPDVDTIEETNWENANALVDKLMGVGQK